MKSLIKISLFTVVAACFFASCKMVEVAQIHTDYGDMYLYLYDKAPLHKANFEKLANTHYFDSTTFHRIIPKFVIQGGDPNSKDSDPYNDGEGGPDYTIPAEIMPELKHTYGAVGAARDNNPEKRSSGSQFYIVVNKNGTPNLDGKYTVFGQVVSGMNIADSIASQPANNANRPLSDIRMMVSMKKISKRKLVKKYHANMDALQVKIDK